MTTPSQLPEKLLPCPFCGSPGKADHFDKIGCSNEECDAFILCLDTEQWNTRHAPDISELQKDKKRLDWFDQNMHKIAFGKSKAGAIIFTREGDFSGKYLREAIDAAMEQTNNPASRPS